MNHPSVLVLWATELRTRKTPNWFSQVLIETCSSVSAEKNMAASLYEHRKSDMNHNTKAESGFIIYEMMQREICHRSCCYDVSFPAFLTWNSELNDRSVAVFHIRGQFFRVPGTVERSRYKWMDSIFFFSHLTDVSCEHVNSKKADEIRSSQIGFGFHWSMNDVSASSPPSSDQVFVDL